MEHRISILKTARYFTYGDPETADNIWIVLHGYAQLPEFFIRKFNQLDPKKNVVIAPEGIHRFYREGTSGRVGASWMTKEARLDDIEDNLNYLNQLANEWLQKKDYKNKIVLGFSQGGATATRWHYRGNFNANHFILWASVFPPDVSIQNDKQGMLKSINYFVVGKKDPYFQGKYEEVERLFSAKAFPIQIKYFDGVHDIDSTTLQEISAEIDAK